jgi:hypothetical protein
VAKAISIAKAKARRRTIWAPRTLSVSELRKASWKWHWPNIRKMLLKELLNFSSIIVTYLVSGRIVFNPRFMLSPALLMSSI